MKLKITSINFLIGFLLFLGPLQARTFVRGTLQGDLGSQMFTIAAVYAFALDHDAIATFPDLLNKETGAQVFSHINSFFPPELHQENKFYHEEHSSRLSSIVFYPNMLIKGQFQTEKYFIHRKKEILDLFSPSTEISDYLSANYQEIIDDPKTVSIHLRTFDHDVRRKYHAEITRAYYERAIQHFPQDSHFIVFSNNMSKAKQLLAGLPGNFRFIENESYFHDFYLMSLCKHHIIANSSFSWWAAYLNTNRNKVVISPKWFKPNSRMFFKDLIPKEWIVLSGD